MALVALLVLACSGDDGTPPPPTDTEVTGHTGTPEPEPPALQAWLDTSSPSGLTATLWADTDRATALRAEVTMGERAWTLEDDRTDHHQVLITGLRADEDVSVEVTVTDELGLSSVATVDLHLQPLPTWIRPAVIEVREPGMEPGVTLIYGDDGIALIDADGQPCWLYRAQFGIENVRRDGDHLLLVVERHHLMEIDLAGNTIHRWANYRDHDEHTDLDVFAVHHDVIRFPDTNLLTLDVERRWLPQPTSEWNAAAPWADAWVAGDILTEFRTDGSVVRRIPLLDLLDPDRIGHDGVVGDYWEAYREWAYQDIRDWSHANSLDYDPATDTLLVSLRHQDAVIAVTRSTGELRWILGNTAGWEPPWDAKLLRPGAGANLDRWQWHQHAAQFTDRGTILLFDNGNFGVPAYAEALPHRVSRAMEIRVDEASRSFVPVWVWGDEMGLWSTSLGDVDLLPETGHHLVDFARLDTPASSTLVEVDDDGRIVWQASSFGGQRWFRSARWAGLLQGPDR